MYACLILSIDSRIWSDIDATLSKSYRGNITNESSCKPRAGTNDSENDLNVIT
jgi:hypothetical protein